MASKKNKNTKKSNRNLVIQIVICLMCLAGVMLFFVYGATGEDIKTKFSQIWENTIHNDSTANATVKALTKDNPDDLLMYVINTGNSDSIVLKTPEGSAMLIDSADEDDSKRILATLKALDIDKLDIALSTHPHADHTGSLKNIISDIEVDEYYTIDYPESSETYKQLEKDIEKKGISKKVLAEADTFTLDSASIEVINPKKDEEYTDANEASMVFIISYGNNKFLFTGDAEEQSISQITQEYSDKLDADFLKVSHHGSSGATTQEFLDAVTPLCAVITVGKGNKYGHPHKEVTQLLDKNNVKTFRTDINGDVAVFSDGNNVICKALG